MFQTKRKGRKTQGAPVRPVCPRRITLSAKTARPVDLFQLPFWKTDASRGASTLEGFEEMSDFATCLLGVVNAYLA